MQAFLTEIPAQPCVIHDAAIHRVGDDEHCLRVRLSINHARRTEWIFGSSLLDLVTRLTVFLGLQLRDAQRIVNEAAGGN